MVVPSQNKYFECELVNKEEMLFVCSGESKHLGSEADSNFCTEPKKIKEVINWIKEVQKKAKETCSNGY